MDQMLHQNAGGFILEKLKKMWQSIKRRRTDHSTDDGTPKPG